MNAGANTSRAKILLLLMAISFMNWFNRESMAVAGNERLIG